MTTIYCDASALLRLLMPSQQLAALQAVVTSGTRVATSAIATVEVHRALRRAGMDTAAADALLDGCTIIDFDDDIARAAAILEPVGLRALDAIHVASALALMPLVDGFVTYDVRQAAAALAAGLPVESPGVDLEQ